MPDAVNPRSTNGAGAIPSWKPIVRRALYGSLRGSGLLRAKRVWRQRRGEGWATVLVFHRINDTLQDGLTASRAQFRSIVQMIHRTYRVLSLRDLVDRVRRGACFTGRDVAITFDDGYRDNYELAAPILREFDLPACFFLTVGYIGTERSFPWDEKHGVVSGIMGWDEARGLQDLGFEMGCHTWSHADLGTAPITTADREIGDARRFMEDKLGARVTHFAYPFGGPENIRPEWVDAVERAGFSSNFSGHGGFVARHVSPYAIPRTNASSQATLTDLQIDLDRPW
jgi:peptidoglycan/xylan/chitin deacetylase (PgdA/CDA1 family)